MGWAGGMGRARCGARCGAALAKPVGRVWGGIPIASSSNNNDNDKQQVQVQVGSEGGLRGLQRPI